MGGMKKRIWGLKTNSEVNNYTYWGTDKWDRCSPVTSAAVRIEWNFAYPWTIHAIFTHKAVGVGAVRDVFGHQGNGDCDLLYVVNGTLNLKG